MPSFPSSKILFFTPLISLFLFVSLASPARSMVILAPCFSDNMVLQQRSEAVLWGKAAPGAILKIITSWNHKNYHLRVGSSGSWTVKVATPAAGGPYNIAFNDGTAKVLNNILIGEVWICSGQSNMELPLAGWGKIRNYQQEIAAANFPRIRLLTVNRGTSTVPQDSFSVKAGGWQICSPQTIDEFSATAYFFGRNIYLDKHVPIGLIHTSWGGTVAEAWTSAAALSTMPDFASAAAALKATPPKTASSVSIEDQLAAWTKNLNLTDSGYHSGVPVWAAPALITKSWKTMQLPAYWESAGLPAFDGIVWFRKTIQVPASQAGKDLVLSLGPIDDNDITWFNGEEIGRMQGYTLDRLYKVPGRLVKEGENLIAVRITDTGGGGGIYGGADRLTLTGSGGYLAKLSGDWSYKPGISSKANPIPLPQDDPNRPTVLFNAMINPLIPYTMRGVIWYQGESNTERAWQYQTLFPLMIRDWRQHWKQGNFPFLYVQLANYGDSLNHPAESAWAELREAQLKALSLPVTGMATIIDIGEGKNIHPKNKQDVGLRLALIARAKVYGEKIEFSGPVFTGFKAAGNKLILTFSHTTGGLKIRNGSVLKGFAVAGKDHVYHWANALIRGNTVVISSPAVVQPAGIRYAWADDPENNLMNGKNLPAGPFRTDEWTEVTRK